MEHHSVSRRPSDEDRAIAMCPRSAFDRERSQPSDEDRAATHTRAFDENRMLHLRPRIGMCIFVDDGESRSLMKPRVRR